MIFTALSDWQEEFPKEALSLLHKAFSGEERREEKEENRVRQKQDYRVEIISRENRCIGVLDYWEAEKFVYLEHLAFDPSAEEEGKEKAVFDRLKAKGKNVIVSLFQEGNPSEQIYLENGFVKNPYVHIRPRYSLDFPEREGRIFSYPEALTEKDFMDFQEYTTREVGILPHLSEEVEIRPLRPGDDLLQVAKLIYLTDPYIYPYWFDSVEDGQKVIREMMELPTLYRTENITVARMKNGDIAGMTVSCDCPFTEEEKYIEEAYRRSGVPMDKRAHEMFLAYYNKMKDPEGHYIANVSVDPQYRKRGIAAKLLAAVMQGRNHCHLECVQANTGSWRLYQRMGFSIAGKYPGVFDVPCFKMIYQKG